MRSRSSGVITKAILPSLKTSRLCKLFTIDHSPSGFEYYPLEIVPERSNMVNQEESLTYEEIMHRFKTLFKRDMTPGERRGFFLPPDTPVEPDAEKP